MHDITITTPAQFAAAVQAVAMPTYEAAKRHPVRIQFATTTYTFREGIHQTRANELVRNVKAIYGRKRRA